MHLLTSGDQYKFRAFQVRAKFVLWAALSPKVGIASRFLAATASRRMKGAMRVYEDSTHLLSLAKSR